MFSTNSELLISVSDAFSAFVYGYPSSCPRAHCTANKSVPTLRYTRRPGPIYTGHACRHLPSAVPWISEDRLLLKIHTCTALMHMKTSSHTHINTLTYTVTHTPLQVTHTHTHTPYNTHTHFNTHPHTLTHAHTLNTHPHLYNFHTHTHTLSHRLLHTHLKKCTHTHTHTHTLRSTQHTHTFNTEALPLHGFSAFALHHLTVQHATLTHTDHITVWSETHSTTPHKHQHSAACHAGQI